MYVTLFKLNLEEFKEDADSGDTSRIHYIRNELLPSLPPHSRTLLITLFRMLSQVAANSATTKMGARNLVIVWAPNLVRSKDPIADLR